MVESDSNIKLQTDSKTHFNFKELVNRVNIQSQRLDDFFIQWIAHLLYLIILVLTPLSINFFSKRDSPPLNIKFTFMDTLFRSTVHFSGTGVLA
jgi:hypothetical protein